MYWTRRKKRLGYDTDGARRLEVEASLTLTEKGEAVGKGVGKHKNRVSALSSLCNIT